MVQIMRRIGRNPWEQLFDIRREMDRLFDQTLPTYGDSVLSWPAEVYETAEELRFVLEAPGMKAEDIDLTIENNVLTVSGEKKAEQVREGEGEFRLMERRYGRFERSFTVPSNVRTDEVRAGYGDGVLTIVLPKKEESKPRRIPISAEAAGQSIESGK